MPRMPPGEAGPSVAIFVAQLLVLMLVGRLLGEAMLRIGQPAVMGQLIAGLLLGPSVLGFAASRPAARPVSRRPEQKACSMRVSQLGILMLLLLTGMETDLRLVRASGRVGDRVSPPAIAVPFICGFALGQMLPDSMLPHPGKRASSPRCSSAPRCRSPRSRSSRWSCAR